jgi:hypothetical protein
VACACRAVQKAGQHTTCTVIGLGLVAALRIGVSSQSCSIQQRRQQPPAGSPLSQYYTIPPLHAACWWHAPVKREREVTSSGAAHIHAWSQDWVPVAALQACRTKAVEQASGVAAFSCGSSSHLLVPLLRQPGCMLLVVICARTSNPAACCLLSYAPVQATRLHAACCHMRPYKQPGCMLLVVICARTSTRSHKRRCSKHHANQMCNTCASIAEQQQQQQSASATCCRLSLAPTPTPIASTHLSTTCRDHT